MRVVQATLFLDVSFHHSERADSMAGIDPCPVLPFAPVKEAEPTGIGATVGHIVGLSYSLGLIAVNRFGRSFL